MECNICHKKIKNVKLVIDKTTYDVNVCATCLKPFTVNPEVNEETRPIIKKIYNRIKPKKK
jgi:protein-arginine kinase activator protein McsA